MRTTRLDTTTLSLFRLTALAAALGAVAAGAAWVLIHLIAGITNLALLHTLSWQLPPSSAFTRGPAIFVAAISGAFVVTLLARWCPVIRGHGIPEAMEAVLTRQSRISPRAALAKPLSSAIAIGTGGPFGAEGPIIVTGGALGSLLGQVLPVTPAERKILLCAGAAAGMAATFGAPIAAVVLAIELLLFEFSLRSIVPLVVATSIAGGLHVALFASGPLFEMPAHEFYGLETLPLFAVLGLACGLLATLISKGLFLVEAGFRRLPVSEFWHPVIGAVGFATVGFVVPGALGVGYDEISDVLNNRLTTATVVALLVAKLLAWWIALGSGTSGGTLAPLLLIAGCFGTLFGTAAVDLIPSTQTSVSAFALVAMAATFGAATRTPLTSIVFMFELTQDYEAVLPLMGTTVLAVLVTQTLMHDSLMTEKLGRRGILVHNTYDLDPATVTRVNDVMSSPVRTLPASSTIRDAITAVTTHGHAAYPLLDAERRCVGMISRSDLVDLDSEDGVDTESGSVLDIASTDIVTISPTATVRDAQERMLLESVDHLPVVDDEGELVGMCTRTDILRTTSRRLGVARISPRDGE
ncbi:MAG: chloride channel protein [Acidimicrobiia bacterium]|nr:chloride channel protein [Acidimicrobiia bacterium]